MLVDVVIPAHGHWHLTQRCLESLAQRDACIREVIVVDDASPDETPQRLRERSDIRAVLLENNVGFSAACNAGASHARADAIFFLNNDTIVPPGAIERLVLELSTDSSIGAAGAKLTYADQTIQSAGCSLLTTLETWRLYAHLDASLPQANVPIDCTYVTGAALLVRAAVFRSFGGFDEGYRNGVEDLDLCLKIWQSGYRVRYVPEASILHLEGASRGRSVNHRANWERFGNRWSADVLASLPRLRPVETPHFIMYWRDLAPVDALVRAHIVQTFRSHGSVRATFAAYPGAPAIERIRSAFERRGVVSIGHGSSRRTAARWGINAQDDGSSARRWAPTFHARKVLIDGGADPSSTEVVRLGFFGGSSTNDSAAPVVVSDARVPQKRLAAIERALVPRIGKIFDVDAFDFSDLTSLREAPLVIFAGIGDAWGLLGGERLAAGAQVVAPCDAPFLEVLPNEVALTADLDDLPDAVAQLRADPDTYTGLGATARRETLLRLPAVYGAERIQELGRAYVGGIIDPHTIEIGAAAAQRLAEKAQA